MMKLKKLLSLFSAACMLFSVGCSSPNTEVNDEENLDSLLEATAPDESMMSKEVVNEIIKSIPSPLEMAALIKSSGADFSESMLNNTDNRDNYTTNLQRSVNLGIYGADLGYINLYEKTTVSFGYLRAVKDLADELKIGQFFDFSTIKRLANSSQNLDSIIYISTTGFEKMNNYLKDKNRGNISMQILVGGWLESLYISTQVVRKSKLSNSELIERIGEQKIVLDDICLLVGTYKNDPTMAPIITNMQALKELYNKITIAYIYAEPETKEVDGMLVIIDNSSSQVNISDEQLVNITQKVAEIRNKLIL